MERENISPARLLSMAIKYRMPLIFQNAFSRLAHNPLHNLSVADLDLIPSSVLCKLLAVHQSIHAHRQDLFFHNPVLHRDDTQAAGCGRGCVFQMKARWDRVAVPMLLGKKWQDAWTIYKSLVNGLEEDGICQSCTAIYEHAFEDILPKAEGGILVKANNEATKSEGFGSRR